MFLSCFPPRRPISERVCLKSTRGAAVSFIRCSLVHFVWTKDLIQIKTDRDRYPEPVYFSSSGDQSLRFRALAAVSPSGSLTNRAPALGAGVDAAFDAIGGAHFNRSYACLASGGLLVGYGSQAMAVGREGLASAALGLARLKLWGALSFLFGGRRALFYNITARRLTHPEEFKADMAALFELLRDGAIHPVVIDRLPLAAASEVHTRIDAGGLGGKIVLLPWPASAMNHTTTIVK